MSHPEFLERAVFKLAHVPSGQNLGKMGSVEGLRAVRYAISHVIDVVPNGTIAPLTLDFTKRKYLTALFKAIS